MMKLHHHIWRLSRQHFQEDFLWRFSKFIVDLQLSLTSLGTGVTWRALLEGLPAAATGEMVELFGMAIFEVDEEMKIVKVEFFYDRGELLASLLKGGKIGISAEQPAALSCPFFKNIG